MPLVMGSRSTYLRAALGGFLGRALRAGDVLHLLSTTASAERRMRRWLEAAGSRPLVCAPGVPRWITSRANGETLVIRAMRGGQFDWFDRHSQNLFFSAEFEVTPQSDRMGYRLAGPPLHWSLRVN